MTPWPVQCAASITGGIGTGKSTALRYFAELGATTWSADEAYARLILPGSTLLKEIAAEFGTGVITADGRLDRVALAAMAFADEEARTRLEAITHPPILADLEEAVTRHTQARAGGACFVAEIPLLYEKGLQNLYRPVILVTAPYSAVINRVNHRDKLLPRELSARLNAQMMQEEKLADANYTINNDGSLSVLRRRVERVWRQLKSECSGHGA